MYLTLLSSRTIAIVFALSDWNMCITKEYMCCVIDAPMELVVRHLARYKRLAICCRLGPHSMVTVSCMEVIQDVTKDFIAELLAHTSSCA